MRYVGIYVYILVVYVVVYCDSKRTAGKKKTAVAIISCMPEFP